MRNPEDLGNFQKYPEFQLKQEELAGTLFQLINKLIYDYTDSINAYASDSHSVAQVYLEPGEHATPFVLVDGMGMRVVGIYEDTGREGSRPELIRGQLQYEEEDGEEGNTTTVEVKKGRTRELIDVSQRYPIHYTPADSNVGLDELIDANKRLRKLELVYKTDPKITRNHDLLGEALYAFSKLDRQKERTELIKALEERGLTLSDVGISDSSDDLVQES